MSAWNHRSAIETAFLSACRAEIAAIKPGNVHIHAPGHDMDADTFERAAKVAAPIIADPSLAVGERIIRSVKASVEAAGCNANLGILLLAAPIARAAETATEPTPACLQTALCRVLATLDETDTANVFAAIAHASPGGLGNAPDHDVRRPPTIDLLDAMRLSKAKDRIARNYVTDFEDVFEMGLTAVSRACRAILDHPALGPAFAVYLRFTSRIPDSHIARKFGEDRAESVRRRFASLQESIDDDPNPERAATTALRLDTALKAEGLNPGTSADLTVATLFVLAIADVPFFVPPLRKSTHDD